MPDNEFRISEVPEGLVVSGGRLDETVVTKAAGFVASQAAAGGMGRYTGHRPAPSHDEIAQLAYSFYESRGEEDGHDTEDWLRAEQILARHYA